MFKNLGHLMTEWKQMIEGEDHHAHSTHAMHLHQGLNADENWAERTHQDPEAHPDDKKAAALHMAAKHGEAEIAHLKAAKHQFRAGNKDVSKNHDDQAQELRQKRKTWVDRASEADANSRALRYPGQKSHRAIHFSQQKGPADASKHPFDLAASWQKTAEQQSAKADNAAPHHPEFNAHHHAASEAWRQVIKAAKHAMMLTGNATEDGEYFNHKADTAEFHHQLHKGKAEI